MDSSMHHSCKKKQNKQATKLRNELQIYVCTHSIVSCGQKHPVNYGSFNWAKHRSSISEKPSKLQGKLNE